MVQWTEEQERAIYTSDRDVLVAAAAGSGKTAVLVERMIQKLLNEENPVDIDQLLVVTFTNAAAQEMRNRIGGALETALQNNPTSNHLKKQISLLQKAPISTLHSFCLDVVKQYAYLLDIDPAFRIADEMEAELIKQDVMNDLFEKWYGEEDVEQQAFFNVVERFSNDRSDEQVEQLILDLYRFATTNPYPIQWLEQLKSVYEVTTNTEEQELTWLYPVKEDIKIQLNTIFESINRVEEIARASDGPYQYLEMIEADRKGVEEALQLLETSWSDLQAFMSGYKFKALSRKKTECSEDQKALAQDTRNQYKAIWEKITKRWFKRNLQSHLQDMQELAPIISHLAQLVQQFIMHYNEAKRARALVDFNDLEHYCLQVLLDTQEDGTYEPSEVALYYQKKFHEILVDEYQDTNLVQETIISMIRNPEGAGNLFMVGDVKQSIYRFRHAEPSLFITKYKNFAKPEHPAERIDLARNFRSRQDVLACANFIFRQILDEELGEIAYDRDAELIYANKTYDEMPYPNPESECIIIDSDTEEGDYGNAEESFEDLEKAQIEARLYALKIKEWIGKTGESPLQVGDKSTGIQRDIQYRDIVILQRSMTWAPTIVDEFKKQGIPVYAELSTGYFAAVEIKIMLSLLKVIDNPRQDIPLASVLRSPIVNFNEEELAQIRLKDRRNTFYDALKTYNELESNEIQARVNRFLEQLDAFRLAARQGALSDLIWDIYRETGFYDFVAGMPGGRQRLANLRALYDRARSYEKTSFRGLYRFLRFIERMEEKGDDLGAARALSEQEDVVRIMTIHKSKGLEFPVVILGGMNKQFNMQDLRRSYSIHKDLGLAVKYINPEKRVIYPTLFYHALNEEKAKEMLAEEMRVLYVALTRAKEKLVMVGNVASFAKSKATWNKISSETNWILPTYLRSTAKSYLDWVGPALLRHRAATTLREDELDFEENVIYRDESRWKISVVHASELTTSEDTETLGAYSVKEFIQNWIPIPREDEEALSNYVKDRLSYEYEHLDATEARAKQSVTEIKRQRELRDEYSSEQFVRKIQAPIVRRPQFMQKEKSISAAERGTAMHTVMQHLPFNRQLDVMEIEELVEALVEREILERELADTIDHQAVHKFYQTEIATYMNAETKIYREVPFNLSVPAYKIYESWKDENEHVFVQGIIDCIVRGEDGWIILDYKTDTVPEDITPKQKQRLIERYKVQLNLYREAVEAIWNEQVEAMYLYFFQGELLLTVPIQETI